MNRLALSVTLSGACLAALAAPALAQDVATTTEGQILAALPQMIRWSGVAMSIVMVAIVLVLLRFTGKLVENLSRVFAERRLLLQKLHTFFQFGTYLVTTIAVVTLSFEISQRVLTILGGTAAFAVGFALKDLAASIVAGVMMLFDRPFQVGDRVSFGGEYGDIIAMGLRSVKLQTLDDNTVTIPNNAFLTSVTSCGNYGVPDMQVVVDFHIGVDQDVHRARDLVREAAATSRYIYLAKPIVVLASQVIIDSYVAIRIRLKAYVLDTHFEKEFETDITLRVLEAFEGAEIHPPAILHRSFTEERALGPTFRVARQGS